VSVEPKRDERISETDVMVRIRQHLPLVVVAALCIWGYVDLKAGIAELRSAREAGVVDRTSAAGTPESPAAVATAPPVADEQTPPEPEVSWDCEGTIEQEKVMETVGQYGKAVFDCYGVALGTNPELRGQLTLELNVGADGSVRQAQVMADMQEFEFRECISSSLEKWRFPPPQGGDCAIVKVPFVLRPEDHLHASPTEP
jgi:hypothetical protein